MRKCKNCLWHYTCNCEECKDETHVVCTILDKHMWRNDSCNRWSNDDTEEVKKNEG